MVMRQSFDDSTLFQLTRLMRGVTKPKYFCDASSAISTHTPHARRDRGTFAPLCDMYKFQLTRLMRGVT